MELLNAYQDCDALALSWIMFGTNHETEYRKEPVTKRFQKCSHQIHPQFKSICQLQFIEYYSNPHLPTLSPNRVVMDTNHARIQSFDHLNGSSDIAVIHHYYTKSEQEFREKIERGRADIIEKRSLTELDDIHHKNNDVVNDDAWNYFIS